MIQVRVLLVAASLTGTVINEYVDSGCIRVKSEELPDRLCEIYQGIDRLIVSYSPQEMAIEKVFMARNPDSALKLGQARGVAIVAGANQGLPVAEYSARQIKQAVVGKGAADKSQVQHMVCVTVEFEQIAPGGCGRCAHAITVCHAHTRQSLVRMAVGAVRRGRLLHK